MKHEHLETTGTVWGWPMILLAALIGSMSCATAAGATATPDTIALKLDVAAGTQPPAGWPVTTGVPFPDGQLAADALGSLRVEADDGRAVPAQFEIRGRYLQSRMVKWLGVSFQLAPGVQSYRLVNGSTTGARPAHPQPVRLEKAKDAYVITTGGFKAEVPLSGALLARAWLGSDLVLEQTASDGNWLTTLDGARHRERAEKVSIEREGPLHTTLRVDGSYLDPQGNPSCKWTARLHFHAGRPEIGITHTFFWVGSQDKLKIRDLALSFALKGNFTQATADASDDTFGESVSSTLEARDAFSLLQDSYWDLGHGEKHSGIYAGGKPVKEGERAGSWLGVSDGPRAVTLALRELWQQFPKELEARTGRLTAYLWRTRGKALPMDFSLAGMEKLLGPVLVGNFQAQLKSQYEQIRANPQLIDPTGMAKTHDLLLAFHRPGSSQSSGSSPSAIGETFDQPPLVLPDPQWTYRSGVVGPLWPRDRARFPEWEKRIDQTWRDVFEVVDDWGDYGFIYHGDGPHYTYRFNREGGPVADAARYTGIEAWVQYVAWLAYLRSGDRAHFRYAHAHTRFLGDLCTSHADTALRWTGLTTSVVIPWHIWSKTEMNGPGPLLFYGNFPDHALFAFQLTGDHRHMDVVRSYAHHWKNYFKQKPAWKEEAVAAANDHLSKMNFARLADLAVLAEGLDDPMLLQEAKALARLLLVPESPDGLGREMSNEDRRQKNVFPSNLFHKGMDTLKFMQVVTGEDYERAKTCFLRMCESLLRTQHQENKFIGYRMAAAYQMTKDPRYAAFGFARIEERDARILPPMGKRGYTGGYDRTRAYDSILGNAYLMSALADAPQAAKLPLFVLHKQIPWPAADFVFQKEAGKALEVELSAGESCTFVGADGKPLPESWLGPAVTYHPHHDSVTAFNTHEPMRYRTIRIPAGAPAGEVRVCIKDGSMGLVFSTSASRQVLVAPRGLMIGPGSLLSGRPPRFGLGGGAADRWFFQVPPGASKFRLIISVPERLTILDAEGKAVMAGPPREGVLEVPVAAGQSGKLWSLHASALADVAFADIVPAFAYVQPGTHFVPHGERVGSELTPVPPWKGGAGRSEE